MILIYQSDQIDMVSSSWIGKLNVRFAYKMSYTQMASETRKTHLVNSFPPMTAQNMETTSERNWWQKRRQRRCRRASERTEAHISRRRETRRTACHCGSRARQTRDEAHPPSPREARRAAPPRTRCPRPHPPASRPSPGNSRESATWLSLLHRMITSTLNCLRHILYIINIDN